MRQRSLMGLVVVAAMLFSAVAWGYWPAQKLPYDVSKIQPPDLGILKTCSGSPFSQKLEDYMLTARVHPVQKGAYQFSVFGRLLPAFDPEKLKAIAENVGDLTKVADPWTKDFLFSVLGEPFVGALPFLWGHCEVLPTKDASSKGPLFRCTHLWQVEGTDLNVFMNDEGFDYILTDGKLDASGALCKRAPTGLKIKVMAANAGADADGDGVPDGIDNCPSVANFSQDVDASGKPAACPEVAPAACDTATVCTADVCANNGFAATCDAATICTAEVCAGLNLSTGGDATADSGGGMCSLIPVGVANPAGLILLLSAVGLIAARRRG